MRIPDVAVELAGREAIRAWIEQMQDVWDYLVQTTHPGTIRLTGDTASAGHTCQSSGASVTARSHLNYPIYHDRYQPPQTAGSSPSVSTRSNTSTPLRWRVRPLLGAPGANHAPPGTQRLIAAFRSDLA